jgi:hypothetical protein
MSHSVVDKAKGISEVQLQNSVSSPELPGSKQAATAPAGGCRLVDKSMGSHKAVQHFDAGIKRLLSF